MAINALISKDAVPRNQLVVRENGEFIFVDLSSVKFIEAEGNYVRLCTEDGNFKVRETMGDCERKLNAHFVRIHRCLIVNPSKIRSIKALETGEYTVRLASGEELTLSRGYNSSLGRLLGRQRLRSTLPEKG